MSDAGTRTFPEPPEERLPINKVSNVCYIKTRHPMKYVNVLKMSFI